eukprot:gene11638-13053_t
MFYRRDNSSTARKEFRAKIEKALKIEKQTDPLHITRVWKFERRTRDYCRAYKSLEESAADDELGIGVAGLPIGQGTHAAPRRRVFDAFLTELHAVRRRVRTIPPRSFGGRNDLPSVLDDGSSFFEHHRVGIRARRIHGEQAAAGVRQQAGPDLQMVAVRTMETRSRSDGGTGSPFAWCLRTAWTPPARETGLGRSLET